MIAGGRKRKKFFLLSRRAVKKFGSRNDLAIWFDRPRASFPRRFFTTEQIKKMTQTLMIICVKLQLAGKWHKVLFSHQLYLQKLFFFVFFYGALRSIKARLSPALMKKKKERERKEEKEREKKERRKKKIKKRKRKKEKEKLARVLKATRELKIVTHRHALVHHNECSYRPSCLTELQ